MSNYSDIGYGIPFRINHPKGDMTVWRKDATPGTGHILVMYWHACDDRWINPPTDSNMWSNAIKAVDRYGIILLSKDYDEQYMNRRKELLRSGVKPWEVDQLWFKEQP